MSKMSQVNAMIEDGCSVDTIASVVQRWAKDRECDITFGQARVAVRKMMKGRSEQ